MSLLQLYDETILKFSGMIGNLSSATDGAIQAFFEDAGECQVTKKAEEGYVLVAFDTHYAAWKARKKIRDLKALALDDSFQGITATVDRDTLTLSGLDRVNFNKVQQLFASAGQANYDDRQAICRLTTDSPESARNANKMFDQAQQFSPLFGTAELSYKIKLKKNGSEEGQYNPKTRTQISDPS